MVRIGVIGSGVSGITAVKTCIEYGYDVVCYEKTHDLGGLWRYKPQECDGEASVMKSTVMNVSKEMCAFSDFPPKLHYANYLHNSQALNYLREYAQNFGVLDHIKYRSEVELVKRADDYEETGKWMVTVKDMETGHVSTETFDGILLCSGHHSVPYEPEFTGLRDGTFEGHVLHSQSYKDSRGFEDKTILVIGSGNSGIDASVELSRVAKQVYLSTRRGAWIWPRVFDDGLPMDMSMCSHMNNHLYSLFPRFQQAMTERKLLKRFDLETYGLLPAHHVFQQQPEISDELPNRILSGFIKVKANIDRFIGQKRCRFEDGTVVDDIDAVVVCTGYKFGLPYLEPGVIPVDNNWVELYKNMYPPNLTHPQTLAAIGFIQPLGCNFPLMEMQSRVFCEFLQRTKRALPSRDEMYEEIHKNNQFMKTTYMKSHRHTIQAPFVPYMHDLASMINVHPGSPLTYLLKGDPKLAWSLTVGPCLSYEFRLRGPHPWGGARDAILGVWDRVKATTRTRQPPSHICGEHRGHGFSCLVNEFKGTILAVFAVFILVVLVMCSIFVA